MSAIEEAQENVNGQTGMEDWIAVATEIDGGWEWSAISFYYSPSARRYFWYSDAGCSCNWHMDHPVTASDFEDGTKLEAIREAKSWGIDDEIRAFDPEKVNSDES